MAVGGANNIAMVREFDSRHFARDLRERWGNRATGNRFSSNYDCIGNLTIRLQSLSGIMYLQELGLLNFSIFSPRKWASLRKWPTGDSVLPDYLFLVPQLFQLYIWFPVWYFFSLILYIGYCFLCFIEFAMSNTVLAIGKMWFVSGINRIQIQEGVINDPKKVGNAFNEYFSNVALNIGNEGPLTDLESIDDILCKYDDHDSIKCIRNHNPSIEPFAFSSVCAEKVKRMLDDIDSSKATGFDNIPPKLLKSASQGSCPACYDSCQPIYKKCLISLMIWKRLSYLLYTNAKMIYCLRIIAQSVF